MYLHAPCVHAIVGVYVYNIVSLTWQIIDFILKQFLIVLLPNRTFVLFIGPAFVLFFLYSAKWALRIFWYSQRQLPV